MKVSARVAAVAALGVAGLLAAGFVAPAQAYPPGKNIVIIGTHVHSLVDEPVTFTARNIKPGASVLIKLVGTTKGKTVKADSDGEAQVTLAPEATGVYSVIAKVKGETTGRTTLYVPVFSYDVGPEAPAGSQNVFRATKMRPYVILTFRINGKEYTQQVNSKGNVEIPFTMPVKKKVYNPPVFVNSKWIGNGLATETLRIRSR